MSRLVPVAGDAAERVVRPLIRPIVGARLDVLDVERDSRDHLRRTAILASRRGAFLDKLPLGPRDHLGCDGGALGGRGAALHRASPAGPAALGEKGAGVLHADLVRPPRQSVELPAFRCRQLSPVIFLHQFIKPRLRPGVEPPESCLRFLEGDEVAQPHIAFPAHGTGDLHVHLSQLQRIVGQPIEAFDVHGNARLREPALKSGHAQVLSGEDRPEHRVGFDWISIHAALLPYSWIMSSVSSGPTQRSFTRHRRYLNFREWPPSVEEAISYPPQSPRCGRFRPAGYLPLGSVSSTEDIQGGPQIRTIEEAGVVKSVVQSGSFRLDIERETHGMAPRIVPRPAP